MMQSLFKKKDKHDSVHLNGALKSSQMKENRGNSNLKQYINQQYSQKSAEFIQNIFFNEKEGGQVPKNENKSQKQIVIDKNRYKFQSTHLKNTLAQSNMGQTQKQDSNLFTANLSSSVALLARTRNESQFFSSLLNIKNSQVRNGSVGVSENQNKDINQMTSTFGENSTKSNQKINLTSNSFSQDILNLQKLPNPNTNQAKGFLFSSKDYVPRNTGSLHLLKQRNTSQDSKEQQSENNIITDRYVSSNDRNNIYPIRERRIYSKSLAKVSNTNNTNDENHDQSMLAPLEKLRIYNPTSTKQGFHTLKSGSSTNKNSFYKDVSHSQSTAVSFKKSFNFSNVEKFPKLQLNLVDAEIKNNNEKIKSLQSQYRSVSQKRNNFQSMNPFQMKNTQYQNASFLNQSKDKTNDFSFFKTPNGIQSIQITDRNVGNEISIIEPDSILFLNNEQSPRDKNISHSIIASSMKDQSISDLTNKYLHKFIKMNPYLLNQEDKLKKLQQLKQKQMTIFQDIQKRNFEEAINQMKEFLTMSSQQKNLDVFAETIVFLGQLHYYNHDLDNALYSFLQLKNLSEIVGSPQIKMKSLILLGQLLQDEQDYDLALYMYRRAIHYSWYLNDTLAETELFDKVGFLYFMKGDIQKAKYFHDRSIQHQSENPNSENRQQSVYTVAKQFQNTEKFIPTLNQMVLAKLGLVTDQQDQLRFSTKISAELQLIILKEDKEINFANHDPSEINPDDLIYSKVIPEGMENIKEYQIIQKILDQKNSFQPIVLRNTLYKDPQSQKIVDHSLLKMTLEEKVQKVKMDVYDNERLQKKLKEAQVSALINRSTKNQKLFYNHCSPNRNLLGFKYTFRPNTLKFKNYFKKMEEMILAQEN